MKQKMHIFDTNLTSAVQRLPQRAMPVVSALTHIGHPLVVLFLAGIVMAMGGYYSTTSLVFAGAIVPATLFLGSLIKLFFGRVRPLNDYSAKMRLDTYSFPSGHATGAMVVYGLLVVVACKYLPEPWTIITTVVYAATILFVGISRVYLGAHYPSDVLAGWSLGLIGVGLIAFIITPFGVG